MKATLAGLCFLAVAAAVLARLVPDAQVRHPMWFFVYLVIASIAIYSWRHAQAPTTALGWLQMAMAAAAFGALFAGAESLVFGPKSGAVLFDVVVAAAAVLVSFSGAVFAATNGRLK